MKRLVIFGMALISVNAMAIQISDVYTFGSPCNEWNQNVVCQAPGKQQTFNCDELTLSFDYNSRKSIQFKDKKECETVRSVINGATDNKPVEIEVSGTKILRVRNHM